MSDSSAAGFAADAIIVGAGLSGLVAACELVDRGLRVLVVDQENSANLGGQAFWSFGGLFFVDSPSSGGWVFGTVTSLPCRTGWAQRLSIAKRTTGQGNGRTPTWISPRARSAAGCGSAV